MERVRFGSARALINFCSSARLWPVYLAQTLTGTLTRTLLLINHPPVHVPDVPVGDFGWRTIRLLRCGIRLSLCRDDQPFHLRLVIRFSSQNARNSPATVFGHAIPVDFQQVYFTQVVAARCFAWCEPRPYRRQLKALVLATYF